MNSSPRKQDKSPIRASSRGAGFLSPLAKSFRGNPFSGIRRSSGSRRESMGAGTSRVDSELSATSSLKGMGIDHAFDRAGYESPSSNSFSGDLGARQGAQSAAGPHQLLDAAFLRSTEYSLAAHDSVRSRSQQSTAGRAAGSAIDQTLSPGLLQAVVSDAESLSASSSGQFSLKGVEPVQRDEASILEQQRFEVAAFKKPADRLPRFQSPGSFVASTTPTRKAQPAAGAQAHRSGSRPLGTEEASHQPSTSMLLASPKIPALPLNPLSRAASIGKPGKTPGSQAPDDVSGGGTTLQRTLSLKQPGLPQPGPAKRLNFGTDSLQGLREPASREASAFVAHAAGAEENGMVQAGHSPHFVLDMSQIDGGSDKASDAGLVPPSTGKGAASLSGPGGGDPLQHSGQHAISSGLPGMEQGTPSQPSMTAQEDQAHQQLMRVSSRVKELEEKAKEQMVEKDTIERMLWRTRGKNVAVQPSKAAGSRRRGACQRPSTPLSATGQEQPILRHLASLSPNSLLHIPPSALQGGAGASATSESSHAMIPSLAYDRPTIARDSVMAGAPTARVSWISQPLQMTQGRASSRQIKEERDMHRASYEGEQSRGGASRRSSDESRGVQAFVDQEVAKRDEQWTAQVARIMENAKVERETAANEIAALRRQVQALSGNLARGADSRGAPGGPLSAPLSQQWQNWDLPGDGAERTHRGTDGSMSSEPDTVPPVPYPISTGTHAEELESLRRRCADLDGLVESLNGDLAQKETELTNLRETHERTVAAMRSAEEALGAADGKINELQAELESVREAAALTTGTRTPEFLSPEKHTTSVPPSPSTLSHAMSDLGSVNEVSNLKLANEALLGQLEEQRLAAAAAESALMLAKDDVRRLEIQVQQQLASLRHGEQQVQEVEASLQEARNEREVWRERYLQAGQEGRQREEELRKQRQGLLEEMEGVKGEKEALRRDLEDAKGEADRARRKQEDLEEALDAKQQECIGLRSQMQTLEKALAAKSGELLQAQCAHQEHASTVVSLQSHVEGLKKLVEHKSAVEVRLNEEKEALRQSLQQASDDARVAKNNFSRLQETRRKEEVAAAELRFTVGAQKEEMERIKTENKQLQADKSESSFAYSVLRGEYEELRAKFVEVSERNLALEQGSPLSPNGLDGDTNRLWGM